MEPSVPLASLDDILNFDPIPKSTVVKIGAFFMRIEEILDPTRLTRTIKASKGREKIPLQIKGQVVELDEGEPLLYSMLSECLVEPKLNYAQVVELSKKTGDDCLLAAQEALKLNGMWDTNVDDAKNDSREEADPTQTP